MLGFLLFFEVFHWSLELKTFGFPMFSNFSIGPLSVCVSWHPLMARSWTTHEPLMNTSHLASPGPDPGRIRDQKQWLLFMCYIMNFLPGTYSQL